MKESGSVSKNQPQTSEARGSIITYSPSKFLTSVGTGRTTYSTHTHTTTATSAATTATKTNNLPMGGSSAAYYVVKAGSLGSAASMSGCIKVSSPPKGPPMAKSPALVVTSPCTPTESSSTISAPSESSFSEKMEHSYMRDTPVRSDVHNGLTPARNILVRHPPQCPSCHTYPPQHEELSEIQQAHVPPYDEVVAKEAMNECARIAKYVKNNNSDEQDWVARVNKFNWTPMQEMVFEKVCSILDQDQLARLANDKRQHEPIHRRISSDKSASRFRKLLASVAWESRITQWIHALLMEHLSPSYMASYLEILQTLKTKLPTLVDKMLFGRPLNNSQELLAPVMKKRWEPNIMPKSRQLTHNAIMVVLPNMPTTGTVSDRMQKWYQALSTITQVVQISLPNTNNRIGNQNLDHVAETIVSITRVKINELRTENPSRGIILVGFNAGAALALQVALSESVACVVCMGFAYNTIRGPRGTPDDRMLDIKAPILFVIGQNSARTSQEEMEGLRERMQSESSLVVVGSADDALRVPKSKRRIEGVTQSMVDYMVVEEIFEFVNRTLSNPPGPRMPTCLMHQQGYQRLPKQSPHILADGNANKAVQQMRKRKMDGGLDDSMGQPSKTKFVPHNRVHKPKPPRLIDPFAVKRKVGRPRTRPLPNVGGSARSVSQKDDAQDYGDAQTTAGGSASLPKVITPGVLGKQLPPVNLAAGTKIKMIPSSQFVQIKSLPSQSKLINYTLNKPSVGTSSTANIGSVVKTLPCSSVSGQQIITLKTPSGQTQQFATAATSTGAAGSSTSTGTGQKKYTVFKNANGMTMLHLTKSVPTTGSSSGSANMDLSNIIDMPIVFADNEGNIPEHQQADKDIKPAPIRSANKSPLIISQKIIKEANKPSGMVTSGSITAVSKPGNIVLNKGLQQLLNSSPGGTLATQNKVVYLNRSTIKPMGNVAPGTHRVPIRIVSTPNTGGAVTTTASSSPIMVDPATGSKVAKTVNVQTIKPTGSVLAQGTIRQAGNVGTKSYLQMINTAPGASKTVAGDGKGSVRNIYFKSATGLKQLPVQMLGNRIPGGAVISSTASASSGSPGLRRVVNIGPVSKVTATSTTSSSIAATLTHNKM
uniref:Reduction in Cnn dots 1, isoform H n=1 Tax=Drosophila melanogaster TaxID=7227 RepID=A0A0B4LFC1_DROME|nr:reduction in Cnn dots 1, isoform H [Drosophila melanogaster]AHN56202.1 reduction in Cnn dots 1, isoform H [Drosophila melanogaster]|eukprot:NP_001286404.1 reduction in Cnn dots 1, isoform H [Drosophila melanogaster]